MERSTLEIEKLQNLHQVQVTSYSYLKTGTETAATATSAASDEAEAAEAAEAEAAEAAAKTPSVEERDVGISQQEQAVKLHNPEAALETALSK